jgi:general secretion pathway protein G
LLEVSYLSEKHQPPYGLAKHMNHIAPNPSTSATCLLNNDSGKAQKAANTQHSQGFTLIELMVVLVIIGVLASLIIPNVLERADEARTTAAKTDIGNLSQALKLYKLDNQNYPSSEQGLQALATKPTLGLAPPNWKPYVDKVPNDPWGHPYQYMVPGIKNEVDVMSFGADGQIGGEGKNADIGSWQ